MKKVIFILFLISLLAINVLAQKNKYSAPVKWEFYQLKEHNLLFLLPKMPVLDFSTDYCKQETRVKYALYAHDVIYGLNVVSKIGRKIPGWCKEKRKFGEKSFKKRIKDFKVENKDAVEEKFKVNEKEGILFKGELLTYLFINNPEENKWFEFWVGNSDISNPEVKNYFESILFKIEKPAIEIGNGSERNLGDKTSEPTKATNQNLETRRMRLFTKPQPRYTEMARKNNFEGKVILIVIFLANGGIGSVTATNQLPYGLTEQAIKAAKRIVFIPAKRKGKNVSEARRIQYSFSIF